jgi:hypothetical protein
MAYQQETLPSPRQTKFAPFSPFASAITNGFVQLG